MKALKELNFRLTVADFDQFDQITPYSICNLFQEIASIHAEELNVGYEKMISSNKAWIVARTKITFYKHKLDDKLVTVISWPHPNGRFDFDRDYLLKDSSNEFIAKGTSKWLIYDLNRNFLCSSIGIMEDVDFLEDKNYEEKIEKIDYYNIEDYEYISDYTIQNSDLDHYNHMNNAKYLLLIQNKLNLKEDELIEEVQIDYINQGYLGHTLSLFKYSDNNIKYLLGKDEDKVIFIIKLKILPK